VTRERESESTAGKDFSFNDFREFKNFLLNNKRNSTNERFQVLFNISETSSSEKAAEEGSWKFSISVAVTSQTGNLSLLFLFVRIFADLKTET
jgi:hypothetical protein